MGVSWSEFRDFMYLDNVLIITYIWSNTRKSLLSLYYKKCSLCFSKGIDFDVVRPEMWTAY